ncbi:MAG TPA: SDR family oxidoreductase, partial [Polyangiales bacterium]
GGSIALASSASGFFGSAGQSSLAIAAGGLAGFVRTAATELRRNKVRLNVVVPTARTRLTEQLPLFASIKADSLSPEHAAQGIVYLLTEAAADVQGEIIGVAGGRLYAFRHAETSGAYLEGNPPALTEIAASWRDVTRR